jgi:hypothetical protein
VTGKGGQGDDEEGPGGGSTGNPPKKRGRKRLKPHPDVLAPVVTVAGGKDLYALRPPGNILRQMVRARSCSPPPSLPPSLPLFLSRALPPPSCLTSFWWS